jgi:hypothetical protein
MFKAVCRARISIQTQLSDTHAGRPKPADRERKSGVNRANQFSGQPAIRCYPMFPSLPGSCLCESVHVRADMIEAEFALEKPET